MDENKFSQYENSVRQGYTDYSKWEELSYSQKQRIKDYWNDQDDRRRRFEDGVNEYRPEIIVASNSKDYSVEISFGCIAFAFVSFLGFCAYLWMIDFYLPALDHTEQLFFKITTAVFFVSIIRLIFLIIKYMSADFNQKYKRKTIFWLIAFLVSLIIIIFFTWYVDDFYLHTKSNYKSVF